MPASGRSRGGRAQADDEAEEVELELSEPELEELSEDDPFEELDELDEARLSVL